MSWFKNGRILTFGNLAAKCAYLYHTFWWHVVSAMKYKRYRLMLPDSWESWETLENPLNCKVIHPVHPKGDQSWVFTGRTDAEAETPILWPPDVKSWLIWKDPDAGKDWGQEEKGMTEDEMVGWHYWLNGHGFGWTLGVGDGQEGLVCYGPWGSKKSDMTERLNWTWTWMLPGNKLKEHILSRFPGGSDSEETACNVGDLG